MANHRVVIVGGGFGGLYCAKALRGKPVDVTLVDRRNFHLFQPLLYQVASGWLSPAEITAPLRVVFERDQNVEVLLGEVEDVDLDGREVILSDGERLPYDSLVVAAGSVVDHFGRSEWATLAPGLKTIEQAIELRRRILLAFEAAERERDPWRRASWLTFVVIGGGTTGVEMAGVLGELATDILRGSFRRIDPAWARIVLVQSRPHVLPDLGERLAAEATADLDRLGVSVLTNTRVQAIDADGVDILGPEGTDRIEARTVIWAAGVRANPLAARLAERSGAPIVHGGQIEVGDDLTLPGHPEVLVVGDMASPRASGEPLPGVAPVAMQQGKFAAQTIERRLEGRHARAFRYRDRGTLATIGRGSAVAAFGPLRFDGFLAWIIWIFIHLLYLVEFQNRAVVVTRWAWDFIRHERAARLITGAPLLPHETAPGTRAGARTDEAARFSGHRPPRGGIRFGRVAREADQEHSRPTR